MNTHHPSQRLIGLPNGDGPYNNLENVVDVLNTALIEVGEATTPSDYALAELVWLAGRAQAEAQAILAKRLGVDSYDLAAAMTGHHNEELAAQLNNIIQGLVNDL